MGTVLRRTIWSAAVAVAGVLMLTPASAGATSGGADPRAWISPGVGPETELTVVGACARYPDPLSGMIVEGCGTFPWSPGPNVMVQTPGTAVLRFARAPASVAVHPADAVTRLDAMRWQLTFSQPHAAGTLLEVRATAPDLDWRLNATIDPAPQVAAPSASVAPLHRWRSPPWPGAVATCA